MTLPDIQVVIDSGLHKQIAVNELTGQNELVVDYISVQNAIQRRGRTGRSCDGVYVPVFSQSDLKPKQQYAFQKMCPWAELLTILNYTKSGVKAVPPKDALQEQCNAKPKLRLQLSSDNSSKIDLIIQPSAK